MQQLRLSFRNNQTFVLTLDFSQIDALYPGQLATAIIRMQISGFEWVTGGTAQGSVVYNPATLAARFAASETLISSISAGSRPIDIRVEFASGVGVFDVASGVLNIVQGVTMAAVAGNAGTGSGLADTVINMLSDIDGASTISVTSDVITAILAQLAALQAEVAALQSGGGSSGPSPSLDFNPINALTSALLH